MLKANDLTHKSKCISGSQNEIEDGEKSQVKEIVRPLFRKLKASATLFVTLVTVACSSTSHQTMPSQIGTPIDQESFEKIIEQPGPIKLETINSADWQVDLSGLLNLDSEKVKSAGIVDRKEAIQVFAHVFSHPTKGTYLVDTGVARVLVEHPSHAGLSWILQQGMPIHLMQIRQSTAEIIAAQKSPLAGVFLTHLHIDHISGLPDIDHQVPIYMGRNEASHKAFMHAFVQGSTDRLLEGHRLFEWQFQTDADAVNRSQTAGPKSENRTAENFEDIIDIFGDQTAFAISVPGHTAGSTAYLLRTTKGPVLLTGDACHTRWGWDNEVEPGKFTEDHPRNLANLKKLRSLTKKHPSIETRLGHQR